MLSACKPVLPLLFNTWQELGMGLRMQDVLVMLPCIVLLQRINVERALLQLLGYVVQCVKLVCTDNVTLPMEMRRAYTLVLCGAAKGIHHPWRGP